jgi:hypothetical protein
VSLTSLLKSSQKGPIRKNPRVRLAKNPRDKKEEKKKNKTKNKTDLSAFCGEIGQIYTLDRHPPTTIMV